MPVAAPDFAAGDRVWVPDAGEGYVLAEALDGAAAAEVRVRLPSGEERSFRGADVLAASTTGSDSVRDVAQLARVNDATVLDVLKSRCTAGRPFTYSGHHLIALNTLTAPPPPSALLDTSTFHAFRAAEPHVLASAMDVYRKMMHEQSPQSIILMGESGSGKSGLASRAVTTLTSRGPWDNSEVSQRVLSAGTVLSAFVCAKTTMNDNASRHACHTRIHFNAHGIASGAVLDVRLFDPWRSAKQLPGERNFHVFYQLLAGLPASEKAQFHLGDAGDHRLTRGCVHIEEVADRAEYRALVDALNVLGFTPVEQEGMQRVLAGMLLLGQIEFDGSGEESASLGEGAKTNLAYASDLIGCNEKRLAQYLLVRQISMARQSVDVPMTAPQAATVLDSLITALYTRLVGWLVQRLNQVLAPPPSEGDLRLSVGVVDVPGFAAGPVNSLDQLCINHLVERLHNFYVQRIFQEHADDAQEIGGGQVDATLTMQTEQLANLFDKRPMGILGMLDEQCLLPKGSAETLVAAMTTAHARHPYFRAVAPPAATLFTVLHGARGEATYDATPWLQHNRKAIFDSLGGALAGSTIKLVAELFADARVAVETSRQQQRAVLRTVAGDQRAWVEALMNGLKETRPHFIHCFSASAGRVSGRFEGGHVLRQLRAAHAMEELQLYCDGFPENLPLDEFNIRYRGLVPKEAFQSEHPRQAAQTILSHLLGADHAARSRVGVTKVYLKPGELANLGAV